MIQTFSDHWTRKFWQGCRNCFLFVQRTIFSWVFLWKENIVFWFFPILSDLFLDFNYSSIRSQKKAIMKSWNCSLNSNSWIILRICAENLKYSGEKNCAALLKLHSVCWEEQFSIEISSENLKIYDFSSTLDTKFLTGL